jgi:hypothetical protein
MLPIHIIMHIASALGKLCEKSEKKEKPLGPHEIEAERLRVEQLVLQQVGGVKLSEEKDLGPHEQRATNEGSFGKVVRCEKCAFEYIYRVRPWAYSPEAAVRIAGKIIFPMPCPMCGWLQRDMVRCARKLRRHRLQLSSIALFLTAVILYEAFLVVSLIVGLIAGRGDAGLSLIVGLIAGRGDAGLWASAAAVCGVLLLIATAVAVVLLVLPVVLLVLRLLLPRFDDPNAGDVEGRIALGKRLAVSKEDYDSGLIVLP